MLSQLLSVGMILLLGAMSPGPDFAMVVKNTLLYSRSAGLYTALGLACAVLIHMSYCLSGIAMVIAHSVMIFNVIKYLGGSYLIYLGISALLSKPSMHFDLPDRSHLSSQSSWVSFKQGFFCNLLNPKATLFFVSIFTVAIKAKTPFYLQLAYALEVCLITLGWFSILTWILSHAAVKRRLERLEPIITKVLGVLLIGFGMTLVFFKAY